MLKVFCFHEKKLAILLFNSIFRTTPEVSGKLYCIEVSQVSDRSQKSLREAFQSQKS